MTAPAVDAPPGAGPISAGAWCKPINGFRGLGAVLVVVGHTFFATRIFPYTGVIHFISVIVPLFFIISAYALYRPFMVAQLADDAQPAAGPFWWRRFLRIYPLYFVALTLYLILLPGVRPESGRIIDYLKLYGFMQIYDPDLVRFSGIPAAWFLCDEVVFYLMIPAIGLLARWATVRLAARHRRRPRAADALAANAWIAVAMIVIGQVSRTWLLLIDYPGATSLPVSNLDYYGFGILLGVASLRERHGLAIPRPVDWLRRRPWVALGWLALGAVAMNLVANVAGTTQSRWEDVQRYGVYSLMVVPFMIVMVLGFQKTNYNRWLSSTRWALLSLLSLHLYLWHQLVLGGFDRYVTEVANIEIGTRFTTGLILCVGAVVATTAWSALLRPGLDWPYNRFKSLLPRAPEAGPLPRWARPASLGLAIVLLVSGVWVAITYGGSPMEARGGVGMISVTHAKPGDTIVVRSKGAELASLPVDPQGSAVARDLEPGAYEVRQQRGNRTIVERDAVVLAPSDHPDPSLYEGQRLEEGMNTIETRDGTKLAAWVELPGPASEGPYPTVVEYSGYQIADPDITQPASAVARALGYATVGVNVRGTGCSAGAFELLGEAQAADGYDVVETVARQDWVQGGNVGLVGFSYGGLGALEVASTAPPSLDSVVALSVFGEARQAFHPGGLANSGFPVGWMQDLAGDAEPFGAAWVQQRVAEGDRRCGLNQALHGQAVDLVERYLGDAPDDGRFDALSPATWATTIDVPVFLAGQLQDATIGTDLADHFDAFEQAPVKKLVLTNGTHGDAVAPQILERMDQFLSLYAADEVPDGFDPAEILAQTRPDDDPDLIPAGPPLPIEFPPGTSVEEAKEIYAAGPEVEVLFESGNGGQPAAAAASTSITFDTWPPPDASDARWFLSADGRLTPSADAASSAARFRTDPGVSGQAYNIEGSDLVTNAVSTWHQPDPATAASWVSEPIDEDQALVGSTVLDLWVKADADDVDLQASLTQIDPEGDETLIQVGWRRLSDALEERYEPGTWVQVPVRLGPVGHLLRSGARLRVIVGTPGDGQVQWSFYPPPGGAASVQVGQGGDEASALVLPTVDGVEVSGEAPGCGDLRGQPCRPYEPMANDEGSG